MDYTKKSKNELIDICRQRNIRGYSSLNKGSIIKLLGSNNIPSIPNNIPKNINSIKYIDLFCGIGGFHIAMDSLPQFESECVFASDINKNCINVYSTNHSLKPVGDINLFMDNIPDHDILFAGFPCQPFSNAGKKLAQDDPRGILFDNITGILSTSKPKIAILENVKHIKKVSNGKVFEYIIKQLNNIGYSVFITEISPMDIGVPQNRERVIFIVIRNDYYSPELKDTIIKNININKDSERSVSRNILESSPDKKYSISDELILLFNAWDEFITIAGNINEIISPVIITYFTEIPNENNKNWKNSYIKKNNEYYNKHKKLLDSWLSKYSEILTKKVIYGKLEWQVGGIRKNDSIWNYYIQMRQSGIRVKKTDSFPSLVAIVQTSIIGPHKRYLTPRECARLQSVPDTFKFNHSDNEIYKQLGNSVNIDVIKVVIKSVLELVFL